MSPEQFELLIRVSEKVDANYRLLSNHLEHHFIYNVAMFTAVVSLSGIIIRLLLNSRNKKRAK